MPSSATAPLSVARLRQLAAKGLHPAPTDAVFDPRTGRAWGRSDFDLNPELIADLAVMDPPRPAAVLVAIVARAEPTLLLTQRTEHLPNHAGQIAFPGGKLEPDDTDAVAAALREAEEEIGLSRRLVEPIGFLDSYRSGTGFQITPVVALVEPGFALAPDPAEVADTFEVPLAFVLDPANHQRHSREWRGRSRTFYAMAYGERYIWGVTAGIIKNLHERLCAT
jgi:8-oxo-dGTP pyrophosphatase MutT (NUDIX family)